MSGDREERDLRRRVRLRKPTGPTKPAKISVRNQSDIIARYGLSNAKPSIVDFILQLPEANLQ